MTRTQKLIGALAMAAVACLLALAPAARADIVSFDLQWAQLVYTLAGTNVKVSERPEADLLLATRDDVTFAPTDYARINGGANFNFLLDLTLTDLPGVDNWSASGTLTFSDTTLVDRAKADFTSSTLAITWDPINKTNVLEIRGILATSAGNDSILLPSGSGGTWTFSGVAANTPDTPDADGTDGQITQYGRASQDNGTLVVLKSYVQTSSLDTLFSANRTLTETTVSGTIVPAPAAIVLGLMGLGTLGLWMRRYA